MKSNFRVLAAITSLALAVLACQTVTGETGIHPLLRVQRLFLAMIFPRQVGNGHRCR